MCRSIYISKQKRCIPTRLTRMLHIVRAGKRNNNSTVQAQDTSILLWCRIRRVPCFTTDVILIAVVLSGIFSVQGELAGIPLHYCTVLYCAEQRSIRASAARPSLQQRSLPATPNASPHDIVLCLVRLLPPVGPLKLNGSYRVPVLALLTNSNGEQCRIDTIHEYCRRPLYADAPAWNIPALYSDHYHCTSVLTVVT